MTQLKTHASIISLTGITGAYCLILLDTTALNISLPSIQSEFHISHRSLQWIVDAYVLIFSSTMLLCGSVADRIGRTQALKIGLSIFTLGSLICASAINADFLITGRIVQGIGAALLAPTSLSLLPTIFPEESLRQKSLVIFSTFSGITQAIGPVIGARLTDLLGWRYIFWINLPLTALILCASFSIIRPPKFPDKHHITFGGNILLLLLICSITFVIIDFPILTQSHIIFCFICIAILFSRLIYMQKHGTGPLNSLLIRSHTFMSYAGAGFLMYSSYYGIAFILTLELYNSKHISASHISFIFLIAALPMVILPYMLKSSINRIGDAYGVLIGLVSELLDSYH